MTGLLGFNRRDLRMSLTLFRLSLTDRFLGSALGLIWALANPLLLLGIMSFVFGFVFKSKLPGADNSLTYIIWLISGYGPWLATAESLSTSTSSVVGNVGLVKNLIFKRELLPIVATLMGFVPLTVSLVYLVALLAWSGAAPNASWLVVPLVMVLQFLLTGGLGLFLAGINVFVRDTAMVLPHVLMLVLFASPILYPITALPSVAQRVLIFSPFYVMSEAYRMPLLTGTWPHPWMILYLALLAVSVFTAGLAFFRRLKTHFDSRL
jgi:lipopolysaccharide transport system permease protein